MGSRMGSRRKLLLLLAAVPVAILVAALIYRFGMASLEEEPRTFLEALLWSAETLTSTGYGKDNAWSHPVMVVFVIGMQLLGAFSLFLLLPAYLLPLLEQRFQVRLPTRAEATDHVVVLHHGPAVATLLEEFERQSVPCVIVEPDEAEARRLHERGVTVVQGSLDDGALERVDLQKARALIANGSDDQNVAAALGARLLDFTGEILAIVEEPRHREPVLKAGATAVFTPRHIVGAALAARASERISPTISGLGQLGRQILIGQFRVETGSDLAGKTLREADLGHRTGVQVLGQWVAGRMIAADSPDMRLVENALAVVAGTEEGIEAVERLGEGVHQIQASGHFSIIGGGEVGSKVAELLRDADEQVRVLDRRDGPRVDVVGDVLDLDALNSMALEDAQAAVVAVGSDSVTLFATVVIKDRFPDLPVIARVNDAINLERILAAGAEYAVSMSAVSGQLLARHLLGEEAVAVDHQLRVVRVVSAAAVGKHPRDLQIRERTGCTLVAVERCAKGEVVVSFGDDFRFEDGDSIFACGTREATARFHSLMS